MILKFEKPAVPNFVKTEQGTFSLARLSEKEIIQFQKLWSATLKERRDQQIKNGINQKKLDGAL